MADQLTLKQTEFISHYLRTGNATEAARLAGYDATTGSLATIGYDLLRHPEIKRQIAERTAATAMAADEALRLTAEIARGEYADFFEVGESGYVPRFDFKRAKAHNKLRLVKSIKASKAGTTVEFFDRLRALEMIGRNLGLFDDKLTISVDDARAKLKAFLADRSNQAESAESEVKP